MNTFDFEKFNVKMDKENASMIQKCIKRPVTIEVIQFKGNFEEIEKFCDGDAEFRNGQLVVVTKEGPLYIRPNGFIVKDENGKFISLTPKQFYTDYEYVVTAVDFASGPDYTPCDR